MITRLPKAMALFYPCPWSWGWSDASARQYVESCSPAELDWFLEVAYGAGAVPAAGGRHLGAVRGHVVGGGRSGLGTQPGCGGARRRTSFLDV